MLSGDESGANDIVSERETQFIPRSDDDEVLWEVQEITAERGKKYKVKWVGIDPDTGKPWAQSWVAKHDCTDKLAAEWKAKKKRTAMGRNRGRTSTTSRASGSSKPAGSAVSGKMTRPSTSEATSSRLDSVEQPLSSPPKKFPTERKRQFESPATTSSGGVVQADEQHDLSRPRKRQKMALEILLPPITSDEDGEALLGPSARAKVTPQKKVPPKSNGASLDVSDEDDSSPPKAKGKSVRRSDARSAGTAVKARALDLREESGLPHSRTKIKAVPRGKERVADADVPPVASQDEELRPSKFKKKSTSKRKSPSEQNEDVSEEEVELAVSPIKVGPPRGIKRRETLKESRSPSKSAPSRTKSREEDPDDESKEPPRGVKRQEMLRDSGSSGKPVPSRTRCREGDSDEEGVVGEESKGPPRGVKRREMLRDSGSSSKPVPSRTKSREDDSDEERVVGKEFKGPRGIKRRGMLKDSGSSSKPIPSRTKSREDDSDEERVVGKESKGHPGNEASSSLSIQQDVVDSPTSIPLPSRISVPQVVLSARPRRSPDLSPGARARLELFDRMMTDASRPNAAPPADVPEGVPDNAHFNYDDTHNIHDGLDTFDPLPHPISPPPSKSKPKHSKLGTLDGLIVPETESSGNSPSQSQSFPEPPSPQPPPVRDQSPRKAIDLPTIAVIAASATSSSASPQDPLSPPKPPPYIIRPSKRQTFKPVIQMSPNTFRSTINARSHVADPEAPPSSIESFTSPKRVDKGKQRAIEEDQLQSSLSDKEGYGERRKRLAQKQITDSELRKRGKELFNRAQLAREAERQKKQKLKRLKTVSDIVNGAIFSSPPKGSPLPSINGAESTVAMRLEEVVDLSGSANSATLDTPEHSEVKPLSKEDKERLRIELRQEEEESTQEAMGVYPLPPVKESEVMDGGDAEMPPPRSPKKSLSSKQIEDIDHVEQPSTDLQLASVIVQASQEQLHEDMDTEPLLANQPASSPPRPVPEIFTDSPKRRLGEALSLLNVKSEEIQRLERELADERKNLQGLKVELAEIQQSSEPTGPVLAAWEAERTQWTQERSKWENDFSEWQTQHKEMSEEKASLSARVAELSNAVVRAEEVRVKLLEVEAERDTWTKERDAVLNDIKLRSEELDVLTEVRGEYDQDQLKWEIERTSWIEEKARWETERATLQEKQEALLRSVDELTVEVKAMTAAKVSAEKDRDFFREQYAQASGFVGSVREENMELEKRAEIAEGQAREGVAAIKALFEGRIEALQADIGRWKGLTELLQEKDRRTNDALRLRAAQAPELVALCSRLDAENKSLRVDVRKLEQTQRRSAVKQKKLYYKIFALKKERASLRSKLSQVVNLAEGSTQETSHSAATLPILEYPESIDPNDVVILPDPMPQSWDVSLEEPALFPCMWRPQWRDQCQQIFDTKEDLERHLQDHFGDLLTQ